MPDGIMHLKLIAPKATYGLQKIFLSRTGDGNSVDCVLINELRMHGSMVKSEAGRHGDPRYHSDDISELKVRIRQLEAENKDLTQLVERLTSKDRKREDWRSVGW